MENSVYNQVISWVQDSLIDYFGYSIAPTDFVEKHIRTIVRVSEVQEKQICNILAEYDRDWQAADCDAEGPTEEQKAEFDKIIENCSYDIAHLLIE